MADIFKLNPLTAMRKWSSEINGARILIILFINSQWFSLSRGNMFLLQLNMNFRTLLGVAFVIRLFLVGFGIYQDKIMVVKYTDIDFHVFVDASRLVMQVSSSAGEMTGEM